MPVYKKKNPPKLPSAIIDSSTGSLVTYKEFNNSKTIASKALEACNGMSHSHADRTLWQDIAPNTSVRDSFSRNDYEYFRPEESVPRRSQEIISACMEAYRKIGIVRNVIDLMGDFGAQGIQLNHPNPRIQNFYRTWFNKVNGKERSERFLNLLYRCSNVIIKRQMATIPPASMGTRKFTALGEKIESDGDLSKNDTTEYGVIPIKYTYLNPLTLEPISPELSVFIGKTIFGLKIPYNIVNKIRNSKNPIELKLIAQIPKDIVNTLKKSDLIPLDSTKISAYYYKKDDWQVWADPMIYAILSDLIVLEKMKMADLAALDGVISQIRVWKLGHFNDANPDASVFPTEAALNRLSEILLSNPGGGAFDLIWGPDLEVKDYTTNVHQFLGGTKYEPVLNSIYAGLGVPPTLTGAATSSGFTNNYISLKTLVQRLEYGRSLLKDFWQKEIELVRQAMGFRLSATITFDRMVLSDEASEKALILQMVDRNLMSIEAAQERMGEDPDLEKLRLKREKAEIKTGELITNIGPYNPDREYELIKLALQRGFISPNQAGVPVREEFDEPPFLSQIQNKMGGVETSTTPKGVSGQGRPKNSKDQSTRKTRTPKAIGEENLEQTAWFLTTMAWVKSSQKIIDNILMPGILQNYKKKNARMLSTVESEEAEKIKFTVLSKIQPFSEINPQMVYLIIKNNSLALSNDFANTYKSLCENSSIKLNRSLTIDEMRTLQSATYCLLME